MLPKIFCAVVLCLAVLRCFIPIVEGGSCVVVDPARKGSLSNDQIVVDVEANYFTATPKISPDTAFDATQFRFFFKGFQQLYQPAITNSSEEPGADILQYTLPVERCDCTYVNYENVLVTETIDPLVATVAPSTATRNEVRVIYKCDDLAGSAPTMIAIYSVSDTSYNITYLNTEHTKGVPLIYQYQQGKLKLGVEIFDWNWLSYVPGGSYLQLMWDFSLKLDSETNYTKYEYQDTIGSVLITQQARIEFSFDRGFVADDVPYRDDRDAGDNTVANFPNLPAFTSFSNPTRLNVGFRNANHTIGDNTFYPIQSGNVNVFTYDPTISLLFFGNRDVSQPQTPQAKQAWRTIVIATCLTVLAVAIIVIVVLQFVGVADFIYPFRRRNRRKNDPDLTGASKSNNGAWTAARKPRQT